MVDRVTQYAKDVLEDKIVVGNYVKLACKRHLNDLESSRLTVYKYEFDIEKANRIINFAETLYIAEGESPELVT